MSIVGSRVDFRIFAGESAGAAHILLRRVIDRPVPAISELVAPQIVLFRDGDSCWGRVFGFCVDFCAAVGHDDRQISSSGNRNHLCQSLIIRACPDFLLLIVSTVASPRGVWLFVQQNGVRLSVRVHKHFRQSVGCGLGRQIGRCLSTVTSQRAFQMV